MTDGVSQEQFYSALRTLEANITAHINERSNALERKLDEHTEDDQKVADRVLTIEVQRAEEKAAAIKRGAWAGIIAAAGVSGVWEGFKHFVWK